MMLRKLLKNVLCGRDDFALAAHRRSRKTHVREEHFAELLRRVDVEAAAGQLEDALTYTLQFESKAFGEPVKNPRIDAYAGFCHAKQDGSERQIDIRIDGHDLRLFGIG